MSNVDGGDNINKQQTKCLFLFHKTNIFPHEKTGPHCNMKTGNIYDLSRVVSYLPGHTGTPCWGGMFVGSLVS